LENKSSALGRRLGIQSAFATTLFAAFLLGTPDTSRAEIGSDEPRIDSLQPPEDPRDIADKDFPYELRKIADKLESPWSIAFLPDGRMLVTERPGRLRVIIGDQLQHEPISGVPAVLCCSHSGLLDILVDPDFTQNQRIFLSYMHGTPEAGTIRIMSATLEGNSLVNSRVIFESRPAAKGLDQIGGRLAFGPDHALYLTIGDRFQMERAQNLMDDGGKIIRINADGSIPSDNPFVGRSDALPEIYSYGHRNPQGLIGNVGDGRLWALEQGPKGGDELNLITPGGNYGWPLVTYGVNYDDTIISDKTSAPGLIDPVHYWVPSVAAGSLVSYYGNIMPDDWRGDFLIGSLAGECLIRLRMDSGRVVKEERYFHHTMGRIRDVAIGPDGYIYLLQDNSEAAVYRLEPTTDLLARMKTPQ
jgi:aldose sugar dehydrogenase